MDSSLKASLIGNLFCRYLHGCLKYWQVVMDTNDEVVHHGYPAVYT